MHLSARRSITSLSMTLKICEDKSKIRNGSVNLRSPDMNVLSGTSGAGMQPRAASIGEEKELATFDAL